METDGHGAGEQQADQRKAGSHESDVVFHFVQSLSFLDNFHSSFRLDVILHPMYLCMFVFAFQQRIFVSFIS